MHSVGEVNLLENGLYISALEHARMLILSLYNYLASLNTVNIVTLGELVKCM